MTRRRSRYCCYAFLLEQQQTALLLFLLLSCWTGAGNIGTSTTSFVTSAMPVSLTSSHQQQQQQQEGTLVQTQLSIQQQQQQQQQQQEQIIVTPGTHTKNNNTSYHIDLTRQDEMTEADIQAKVLEFVNYYDEYSTTNTKYSDSSMNINTTTTATASSNGDAVHPPFRIIVKVQEGTLLQAALDTIGGRAGPTRNSNEEEEQERNVGADDNAGYAQEFARTGIVIDRGTSKMLAFELRRPDATTSSNRHRNRTAVSALRHVGPTTERHTPIPLDSSSDPQHQRATLLIKLIQTNQFDSISIDQQYQVTDIPSSRNHHHHQQHQQHHQHNEQQTRQLQEEGGTEVIPYGVMMVQADYYWSRPTEELLMNYRNRQVCIVDTGIRDGHPDLPSSSTEYANAVTGTSTFAGAWQYDVNGHGTHVAGTIGAIGNNGRGVVGIRMDPSATNYHVAKAMDDDGIGYGSTVMESIEACAASGAHIITLSIEGDVDDPLERDYYHQLYNNNVLIIAAAGNSGNTGLHYPASYETVMSVGAIDMHGQRGVFSQCNTQVELVAPGVDIYSTCNDNNGVYCWKSGTSMAAPHVAGVASALWSTFPDCTNYQIRNVLVRTAKHVGTIQGCSSGYGNGLVQLKEAYTLLLNEGCVGAGGPIVDDPVTQAAHGGCKQRDYQRVYKDGDAKEQYHPYRNICDDNNTTNNSIGTGSSTDDDDTILDMDGIDNDPANDAIVDTVIETNLNLTNIGNATENTTTITTGTTIIDDTNDTTTVIGIDAYDSNSSNSIEPIIGDEKDVDIGTIIDGDNSYNNVDNGDNNEYGTSSVVASSVTSSLSNNNNAVSTSQSPSSSATTSTPIHPDGILFNTAIDLAGSTMLAIVLYLLL